jgi:hypothetical protein
MKQLPIAMLVLFHCFCFAPAVAGKFKIAPGKKYVSRYRYLVTSEAANPKLIKGHWRQYAKDQ